MTDKNLASLRIVAADEWFTESDLNGHQITEANGWEYSVPNTANEISRAVFIEGDDGLAGPGDHGFPSVRMWLTVTFKPDSDEIDYATLGGELVK